MDVNVITQLVTTVGFPIACCIALFYMLEKNNTRHMDEMNSIKEALNNNTIAVTKLYEKLNE